MILFEAAAEPGGQVRITAGLSRRREIMGIVDWRVSQCQKHSVAMRYNLYARPDDVLAERPDIVVLATGGLPNTAFLDTGEDLVTTTWDLLTGAARPAESVILYDDHGAHPGMTAAEFIAEAGSRLEIVTPERVLAPDIGATSYPAYFEVFSRHGVTVSLNLRLESVRREGNQLVGIFFDEYGKTHVEKRAEQIVVEHGTVPLDELYFSLKPRSRNLGEVDHDALIANLPQRVNRNRDGEFLLYRIGDAVASRNIHAAVYDALRLAKDF